MTTYLLDTNHCSYLLQGHTGVVQQFTRLSQSAMTTNVIVQGELFFMAEKSAYSTTNLELVRQFLSTITIYPIDSQTAEIYGQLKAAIIHHFGPKEKSQKRNAKIERLGFSENDLWIAATAKRHQLVLVSNDSDFIRLQQIENLVIENWYR